MITGWISIRRGALEHDLLRPEGKHSRFEAWVWLIEKAAFKAVTIDLHGTPLVVPRGALCYSLRALAAEWGWSVKAVRTFLSKLEMHGSISIRADQKGHSRGTTRTIITICNYEKYQSPQQGAGTTGAQQGHTKEQGNTLPIGRGASAPEISDADLYRLGRHVLGRNAGGQITRLKNRFGVPKATALLQEAEGKASAAEWIAGVLNRNDESDQKLDAWGIADAQPVRLERPAEDQHPEPMAGTADLPEVQRGPEGREPQGPMSLCDADTGRAGDPLPPLRALCGGVL